MSDIVQRLRDHVNQRGGPTIENGASQMMMEAATEIERWRRSAWSLFLLVAILCFALIVVAA